MNTRSSARATSHDNVVRFFDATNASRIKQLLAEESDSDDDDFVLTPDEGPRSRLLEHLVLYR